MSFALLVGCSAKRNVASNVRFSSGNQTEILKEDNISGEDAANIIKSYSKSELMLTGDYSIFISSETAEYDNENYYKIVAGKAVKNKTDYYIIDEIGCYLVSLNGKKAFIYDKKNGCLIPLNTIIDIIE